MTKFSFKKREKVKKSIDFLAVYKKGYKKESKHFNIAVLPNNLRWRRLGLTVSKKIGNSVSRNYVKRRLREFFRLHKENLPESCDIVFTAKIGANRLTYAEIREELNEIFCREAKPSKPSENTENNEQIGPYTSQPANGKFKL
jgi:ribonuclease P protein component